MLRPPVLTPAQLLNGYARGVFPMAESADDDRLWWFDPPMRGVLPIGGIHASRSLRRDLRRGGWSGHFGDFATVVRACADRESTWINEPLFSLYLQLNAMGHAHAIEVRQDGIFAGGIFGVTLGAAFFGESMVSARTNGSKMALLWTSSHLARCGFRLFDTQFLTPHLERMGGFEIPRTAYRRQLAVALSRNADFGAAPLPDADQLWQEITQTS
ncbi:leucyl/phenylalanyl-tRNA--protein transferase [Paracoccus sp. 1_MG-2023]|uniref:leucyl/phenylalanyl-tRNA--protein transferase n=1 Tax=unclassified Paracoccus (in: a-proteobacteria) TaxID=2688777 RepID=UPI001C0A30C4|nr:leucyl/phenylalanyl-tRNA--protein transferase [Paracoccus sp. 1_MG-2023]MBU2956625.1 leucyl/phenylalanyl-tRNA--protein transferase [Paracoccus sp. C2R09]MDO6668731.1 leucyl/phenylalanyl-tRNA--protein transferase [Paracoccus sp. 1_MG-2023]